jgi:hypothetical protein
MRQTGTFLGDFGAGVTRTKRYSGCNLPGVVAVISESIVPPHCLEQTVFSCDYNGWADVPEDEREAIEAFEYAREASADPLSTVRVLMPLLPAPGLPQRKAA